MYLNRQIFRKGGVHLPFGLFALDDSLGKS